jgi:hypothetical protein
VFCGLWNAIFFNQYVAVCLDFMLKMMDENKKKKSFKAEHYNDLQEI